MDSKKKYINEALMWALTNDAKKRLKEIMAFGFDFDLAFTILEEEMGDQIYIDLKDRNGVK